jgi:hypothetical protein
VGEWSASRLGRAFIPGERIPGTHCTGGWVGPRAGLDPEARGKILCLRRGSNPDHPVVQPVVRHYTAKLTRPRSVITENFKASMSISNAHERKHQIGFCIIQQRYENKFHKTLTRSRATHCFMQEQFHIWIAHYNRRVRVHTVPSNSPTRCTNICHCVQLFFYFNLK